MSTRTRSPAAVEQDASGVEWIKPTEGIAADDVPAQVWLNTGQESSVMTFTEFGFSLPTDATVLGVTVTLRCSAIPTGAGESFTVFLVLDGDQLAVKSADPLFDYLDDQAFGGGGDLWSATITPAMVNSATWGCQVKAGIVDITPIASFSIDQVTMTITYSGGTETRRAGKVGVGIGIGV